MHNLKPAPFTAWYWDLWSKEDKCALHWETFQNIVDLKSEQYMYCTKFKGDILLYHAILHKISLDVNAPQILKVDSVCIEDMVTYLSFHFILQARIRDVTTRVVIAKLFLNNIIDVSFNIQTPNVLKSIEYAKTFLIKLDVMSQSLQCQEDKSIVIQQLKDMSQEIKAFPYSHDVRSLALLHNAMRIASGALGFPFM